MKIADTAVCMASLIPLVLCVDTYIQNYPLYTQTRKHFRGPKGLNCCQIARVQMLLLHYLVKTDGVEGPHPCSAMAVLRSCPLSCLCEPVVFSLQNVYLTVFERISLLPKSSYPMAEIVTTS